MDRATGAADELSAKELVEGARRLETKVRCHRPAAIAFLGITAYRTAFGRWRAHPGRQAETIAEAGVWVLPNPSGRCVSFSVDGFRELYVQVSRAPTPGGGA